MTCPTGVDLKVGVKKGATWGTAVECGAGDGVQILDDTVVKDQERLMDDSRGEWAPTDSDPGEVVAGGDLPMYLRYDGIINLLLGLACGQTGGAPSIINDGPGYSQTFTPVADTAGLFATLAKLIGSYVKENPSVKFNGLQISGETGQPMTITFPLIADNEVNDSTVNTTITMANVTTTQEKLRVLFSQSVVRINDQSDGALDSGDVIAPVSIELIWNANKEGVYDRTDDKNLKSEPCNNGKPEFILNMRLAKNASNTNLVDLKNDTPKKIDITFTGPEIESGVDYTFVISIPYAKFSDIKTPTAEGIIGEELSFVLHEASAAPTGMSSTEPFYIDVQNTQSTDVLA